MGETALACAEAACTNILGTHTHMHSLIHKPARTHARTHARAHTRASSHAARSRTHAHKLARSALAHTHGCDPYLCLAAHAGTVTCAAVRLAVPCLCVECAPHLSSCMALLFAFLSFSTRIARSLLAPCMHASASSHMAERHESQCTLGTDWLPPARQPISTP